jgi:diguanylate cyclase (GGDEF)-like protein
MEAVAALLDRLCPMHVQIDPEGVIRHAGPTMHRLREGGGVGEHIFDLVSVRRPQGVTTTAELMRLAGWKLHATFRKPPRTGLKGLLVPFGEGAVINFSFGISVTDAVRDYGMTAKDFAPTDLAVEMLYLVEAKSAAMAATQRLNRRLQGAKEEAEEQAVTDLLTGLRNRRAMEHTLARMAEAGQGYALMEIDLDYFKQVNDSEGHAAGDHVLRKVGAVLRGVSRREDVPVRAGGDEFALILPGLSAPRRIGALARQIICALEEPIEWNGRNLRISASIGVALSEAGQDAEGVMRRADLALYAAKRAGRGRSVIHRADLTLPLEIGKRAARRATSQ